MDRENTFDASKGRRDKATYGSACFHYASFKALKRSSRETKAGRQAITDSRASFAIRMLSATAKPFWERRRMDLEQAGSGGTGCRGLRGFGAADSRTRFPSSRTW